MRKLKYLLLVTLAVVISVPGYISLTPQRSADAAVPGATALATQAGRLTPLTEMPAAQALSQAERAALHARLLELRERVAAQSARAGAAAPAQAAPSAPETRVGAAQGEFHTIAGNFMISRNRFVPTPFGDTSTVQEPAAHNEGKHLFYTRNWNTQYSLNGGGIWTTVPIPGGPADAPFFCCDQDVVTDGARGVTFWSNLYINAAQTNGVVLINVRRHVDTTNCFYIIDPAGTADNILPDYPHIALSNDFLYLTTNNISGSAWGGAQLYRFALDQMAGCESVPFSVLTWTGSVGQRIALPAEGAREVQYFTMGHEDADTLRLFYWRESGGLFTVLRDVAATNFANSDCRGGVGNFDWIEGVTSWGIYGFRHRIAVGKSAFGFGVGSTTDADGSSVLVAWNAGRSAGGAPFPQAYVGQAVFREVDLALIGDAPVWNANSCFGYPAITSNKAGNFGISLFFGGQNGGGGTAAQGYVGIDDDFTPTTLPVYYQTIFLVASGDRNASNNRTGDYVTIHPHNPCQYAFSATSMALNVPGSANAFNTRYVEFHRGRYRQCWSDWSRASPRRN